MLLTEQEVELAKRMADGRSEKSRAGVVSNRLKETTRHSGWEIDYAGARAEVAVCKRLNFPVATYFSLSGDNNEADLYFREFRVEVKCAMYDPPTLKFNTVTEFKSDVVVMCFAPKIGTRYESRVLIAGCVTRWRFAKEYKLQDFGKGTRATMEAQDLTPLVTFEQQTDSLKG